MSDMMLKNLMKMVSTILPPKEEPANEISAFVDAKINDMMPDEEIAMMFKTVFISYCNRDPETAYITLVELANDVAKLNESLKENEGT